MADDKLCIGRDWPPFAFVFESGGKYVNVGGSVLEFDTMNRLCSWWIQYIAEHPQPEVKGDG